MVHLDGCVEVDRAYYAAPPGWIGREVAVQWDGRQVRLLDPRTGQLLREHRAQRPGAYAIPRADQSPRTPPTTVVLLARATRAGTRVGALCDVIHRRDGAPGIRRIFGIIALIKKYGPAVVDEACAAALECGATTYRFVRRYLEHRPPVPLTLRQVDPLIRELTHYRAVIAQKGQEVPT
jgi:hypothetical protein